MYWLSIIVFILFGWWFRSTKKRRKIEEPLLKIRKEIFPFYLEDLTLQSKIINEPQYKEILKKSFKIPTYREMVYLLKYKKFMESKEVFSMCGEEEINQMEILILNILDRKIPGVIVETGSWRGGMAMYARAILKFYKDDRSCYLFDTFKHFPSPQTHQEDDKDCLIHSITYWLFENSYHSPEQVKDNFKKFDLWDEKKVKIVQGLFEETIPAHPLEEIALLRLDSDYYESTLYVLENYYEKISKGGFVIIDDYNNKFLGCKKAVDYFRFKKKIESPIMETPNHQGSVYWQIY